MVTERHAVNCIFSATFCPVTFKLCVLLLHCSHKIIIFKNAACIYSVEVGNWLPNWHHGWYFEMRARSWFTSHERCGIFKL